MSIQQKLDHPYFRFLIATVLIIAAFLLRQFLVLRVGLALPPFITVYPMIVVVALLFGLWPGVLATGLATVMVDWWVRLPTGNLAVANPSRAVTLVFFVGTSFFTCVLADGYRRKQRELAAFVIKEAVDESDARLAAVVQTAPVGIAIYGADGELLKSNSAARKILGVSEPVGKRLADTSWRVVREDGTALVPEEFPVAQVLKHKVPVENFVLGILREDGEQTVWVLVNALPRFAADGNLAEVTLAFMDITQRKYAEEALSRSEARLRLAQLAANAGTWEWDLRTNENVWSEELWKVYGLPPHCCRPSYASWRQSIHPEDRDRAEHAALEASRLGKELRAEWRVLDADGTERWLMSRGQPQSDADGVVTSYLGIVLDITERKRAEEALKNSRERMAAIIGSATDAIITIDAEQQILGFNAAAERIFGCGGSEAIGQTLDRFIPAAFREAHRAHVEAFAETGTTSRSMNSPAMLLGLRANGDEFPLEATISQVTVSGEKLYTVILRDLTQRVQTERALIRSEKLATVGRMAATIAHEINNPLAAVTNLLFLIGASPDLPESARQYLDTVDGELKRIAHITRLSLGFYRESEAVGNIPLRAVLESTLDLLKSKIKAKQAVIEKDWDGNGEITAKEGELRQIFSNLIINGLDAIDRGGTVKVRMSAVRPDLKNGHRCVRVTIADNGQGIRSSEREHIFEPFFTTKGTLGNGLGLWVTKQIVDKHFGSIRVRSSTGGAYRGTSFSVVLPVEPDLTQHVADR
jgi:PAS domain S-box-containing protein